MEPTQTPESHVNETSSPTTLGGRAMQYFRARPVLTLAALGGVGVVAGAELIGAALIGGALTLAVSRHSMPKLAAELRRRAGDIVRLGNEVLGRETAPASTASSTAAAPSATPSAPASGSDTIPPLA